MKKLLALILVTIIAGCTMNGGPVQVAAPNPMQSSEECNAKLDKLTAGLEGVSIIRQRVPNPCDAERVLVVLAKGGVIWDVYKIKELKQWTAKARGLVVIGISYNDLQLLITSEIKRFNAKVAGTYLMLSDTFLVFNDTALISKPDQAILIAGLDDIDAQADRLALLLGQPAK